MFKQSKEPEKKGSEKREDLLVSFLKDAHFVFAIIVGQEFGCDCSGYSVQGIFVTETFVYYSIMSEFPIIPIAWLNAYIETNDKLCFLRQ